MKAVVLSLVTLLIWSGNSNAQSCKHYMNGEHMKDMTPEQREKMADMHLKMGECLKNKDMKIEDCHKTMSESCPFHNEGDGKSCAHHKEDGKTCEHHKNKKK